MPEARRFIRFCLVGTCGFAVDAGLLSLLVHLAEIGPYVARAPSFLAAVTVTWALNRRFAFDGLARHTRGREYRRYVTVQTLGAMTNLVVYVIAIALVPWFAEIPVLPLAIGSGVALVVNFTLSRIFVFPGARPAGPTSADD